MPKLQVGSSELVNADAEFVSLVKRGANRIPFRITKEDTTDMIDLAKIGRSLFKQEAPKPAVVAVITQKGVDIAALSAIFDEAGLESSTFVKAEEGTIVTLTKQDTPLGDDSVVLKVSDEVAVVVSGLQKAFDSYSYTMTDFNEVIRTEGVYPMMYVAKDALGATISNILYKAASPGEAAEMVGQAIDSFRVYMTGILGDVPVTAFKMENALHAAGSLIKAADKGDEPIVEPKVEKTEELEAAADDVAKEGDEYADAVAKEGDAEPDVVDKGEDPPGDTVEKAEEPSPVASGDFQAMFAAMQDQLTTLITKNQEDVQKQIADLGGSFTALDSKLNEAVAKMDGTVFMEDAGDAAPVQKSESAKVPPLLDTAYTPIRKRA